MEPLLAAEITAVELLVLVSLVAMLAQRVRIPYTVVLILVGLLLSFQSTLNIALTPELILLLFLPPLVFEAALHIEYRTFRQLLTPILLLAIPGVLISTAIVAGIMALAGVLDWRTALIFGSLIAATDPVAVVSLFKLVGAPHRLATLVESESLFNDATTIVVFNIIIAAVATGAEPFRLSEGMLQFLQVALGGAAIGIGFGLLADRIFSFINDHLIETTISTVVAYGAYLLAERFHVSGVLAVVFAGILIGTGSTRSMSPTTRSVINGFWEYIAFLANSVVFILIGMEIDLSSLSGFILPVLAAVVAVLLARAISVYALSVLSALLRSPISLNYRHVLFWGGLRGAVSLALVLSLSHTIAARSLLINLTFGVVLFTLLVQATTISPLLRRLGLVGRQQSAMRYEQIQGRLLATRAAYRRLEELHDSGVLDPDAWDIVSERLSSRLAGLRQAMTDLSAANPEVLANMVNAVQREALRTQRAALLDLQREGVLSEAVMHELIAEVDEALENPQALMPDVEFAVET